MYTILACGTTFFWVGVLQSRRGNGSARMPIKSEITAFQASVYDAVRLIPRGKVTTYGLLADYLGCRSCQAVGQALKRNPFAPEVPCHRVIASDMTVGGFNGHRSGPEVQRKIEMLLEEEVDLEGGSLTDTAMLFTFSATQ